MGFKGIIVTDALEMGGIAQGYSSGEAAVLALEAGADALVMPPDPEAAVKAILAAVQSGRLTRARIDESVARLLAAKERMGLDRRATVDLEAIGDQIDMPEDQERAQEIADRAVTLVKNDGTMPDPAARAGQNLFPDAGGKPLFERRTRIRAGSAPARKERHRDSTGRFAAAPLAGCGRAEDGGMRRAWPWRLSLRWRPIVATWRWAAISRACSTRCSPPVNRWP